MENKLTRANKLSICLTVFYAVIALVTAFGLDATYSVFARTNPIAALGALFGFPAVAATPIMWLMLIFILVYIVLFDMAVCYIMYWLRRHGSTTASPSLPPSFSLSASGLSSTSPSEWIAIRRR